MEELRRQGIPVSKAVSVEVPASRKGYFSDYHHLVSGEATPEEIPLECYPWVKEASESGQPVAVDRRRLDQAGFSLDVQALLEVPLPGGGSLGLNSLAADAFSPAAVRTVQVFAGLIAESLQRLGDFEQLRQAAESARSNLALERVRNPGPADAVRGGLDQDGSGPSAGVAQPGGVRRVQY